MRCDQITEYLSAYIEGELEPGLRLNVDQHIEECVHCREELAAVADVFSAFAAANLMREPPEILHDNVMRRLRVEQREKHRTPVGWFASLTRGWQTATVGVAFVAVAVCSVVLGPLHSGSTAGIRLPWHTANTAVSVAPSMTLVGSTAGFRQAGTPDELLIDLSAPGAGHWKMTMDASAGIVLPADAPHDPAGGSIVWEGDLAAGNRQRIPVTLVASNPNAVNEISVRLSGPRGPVGTETTVLLPVQTHVTTGTTLNWQTTSATTVSQALSYLAGSTGMPIAAPSDAMQQQVSVNMASVPADDSIEAVAAAASLKVDRTGSAYNLHK